MRDRVERINDRRDRDRHDDDGDRDRDGRGHAASRGWRETLRCSLSRSGRACQDGGSRGNQDLQRERSGNHDGGRCRAADDAPVLEEMPLLVQGPVQGAEPMLKVMPLLEPGLGQGAAPVVAVLTAPGAGNEDAPILEDASDVDEPVTSVPHGRLLERDTSPHSSRRFLGWHASLPPLQTRPARPWRCALPRRRPKEAAHLCSWSPETGARLHALSFRPTPRPRSARGHVGPSTSWRRRARLRPVRLDSRLPLRQPRRCYWGAMASASWSNLPPLKLSPSCSSHCSASPPSRSGRRRRAGSPTGGRH
jgi:hypothetical protein